MIIYVNCYLYYFVLACLVYPIDKYTKHTWGKSESREKKREGRWVRRKEMGHWVLGRAIKGDNDIGSKVKKGVIGYISVSSKIGVD